jgi:hypothetical protein
MSKLNAIWGREKMENIPLLFSCSAARFRCDMKRKTKKYSDHNTGWVPVRSLLLILATLSGCSSEIGPHVDQCMRRDIFQQCLQALPAGPTATMYNDWDEVVAKCDDAAYYQSLRARSQIKQECQSK